jgi:hypothetical protein
MEDPKRDDPDEAAPEDTEDLDLDAANTEDVVGGYSPTVNTWPVQPKQ